MGGIGPNRLCCLAGGFHGHTSTILKITYLKSGCFRDKNDVLHVFVASVSIFWSLKSGVIQNGLFEVFKAILAFTATQTNPFALQKPFNRNPHD